MPRLGGAYCFRRVRSQRKSIDWGTMGPALGEAYECYAHISSFFFVCLLYHPASRETQTARQRFGGRHADVTVYIITTYVFHVVSPAPLWTSGALLCGKFGEAVFF